MAISAGVLAAIVIAAFAGLSAWWFFHEQLDIFAMESFHKPSSGQRRAAGEEVTELVTSYLLALPVIAVMTAAGAWWLADRLTAPLVSLARTAESMNAQTLHERLPESEREDEISRLTMVLNRLFARLESSFAQASRFAADASHELRTPLAVMRGILEEEIQQDPFGPKATRFVELLEQNQRLVSIADKLLLLTRADADQLLSHAGKLNLTDLIQEIADEDVSILAEQRKIELATDLAPDIWVMGDASLLRQLVFNLFDNAIKYNMPGGWVRAKLERVGPQIHFSVSNSGDPIPKSLQQRLFERFFRVNSSRERLSGGAGLGLSLCREIASAHRGRMEFVSSSVLGTTFRLVLSLPPSARNVTSLLQERALSAENS